MTVAQQPLNVLFLYASYPTKLDTLVSRLRASRLIDTGTLEELAQAKGHPIQISVLETSNTTVAEISKKILDGGYDSIVLSPRHCFYYEDKHDSTGDLLAAYETLGIKVDEYSWARDTIYEDILRRKGTVTPPSWVIPGRAESKLSGVALVRYLRNAFDKSASETGVPKFGYMADNAYEVEIVLEAQHELGIQDRNSFILNSHDEDDGAMVEKILVACGRELKQG